MQELTQLPNPRKFDDFIGKTFNLLTIVRFSHFAYQKNGRGSRPQRIAFMECSCDCGGTTIVSLPNIKKGATKSCGCTRIAKNKERSIDISGNRYGKLVVLEKSTERSRYWKCLCDCGNESIVSYSSLTLDSTKSCGCFRREVCKDNMLNYVKQLRVSAGLPEDLPICSENKLQRALCTALSYKIYKRDGNSCVWCSSVDCKLNAHHLKPWVSCTDGEKFDPKNLVSLCLECHSKIHMGNNFLPPDPVMTILLKGYTTQGDLYGE